MSAPFCCVNFTYQGSSLSGIIEMQKNIDVTEFYRNFHQTLYEFIRIFR